MCGWKDDDGITATRTQIRHNARNALHFLKENLLNTKAFSMLVRFRNEMEAIDASVTNWNAILECHAKIRPILVQHFPDHLEPFDKNIQFRWHTTPHVFISNGDRTSSTNIDNGSDRRHNDSIVKNVQKRLIAHLNTVIDLADVHKNDVPATEVPRTSKIFIVHGHDEEMKQSVAHTLEKLGLTPIILHEQPTAGKTIIEKFERDADVGFAVILLSPDDMGYKKTDGANKAKPRARENVILELGYFVGKLGRDKVMALKRGDDFEVPSDLSGVVYTPFDSHDGWKSKLVKELKAAGYAVSADDL